MSLLCHRTLYFTDKCFSFVLKDILFSSIKTSNIYESFHIQKIYIVYLHFIWNLFFLQKVRLQLKQLWYIIAIRWKNTSEVLVKNLRSRQKVIGTEEFVVAVVVVVFIFVLFLRSMVSVFDTTQPGLIMMVRNFQQVSSLFHFLLHCFFPFSSRVLNNVF
jgi:hypothetical protein